MKTSPSDSITQSTFELDPYEKRIAALERAVLELAEIAAQLSWGKHFQDGDDRTCHAPQAIQKVINKLKN